MRSLGPQCTPFQMKITSAVIQSLVLDPKHSLLNVRQCSYLLEYFKLLATNDGASLDDIQFRAFLLCSTDLTNSKAERVFELFDVDRSGSVEFDEFYFIVCILAAVYSNSEKRFLNRHWRACFELLDEDGSNSVSVAEFETLGFLFGFSRGSIQKIFDDFDVSGNQELEIEEFRLFVLAALDAEKGYVLPNSNM